jgi:hypothetical protein
MLWYSVLISVCKDKEVVKSFMLLPEIWRYAAEYGTSPDDIRSANTDRNVWLMYSINNDLAGLTQLEIINGAMASFHPYILREYKAKYDIMIKEIFSWFLLNIPKQIEKLNAYIPIICKGALLASDRAGMKTEGLDRKSFLTEFGAVDRVLKGITRQELMV